MPVRHPHPVKRFLRHRRTQQYFLEDGKWTSDPKKAKHFDSIEEAAAQARRSGLGDSCSLVLEFDGANPHAVHLPLPEADETAAGMRQP